MKFQYVPERETNAALDPEASPRGRSRAEPAARHEFNPAKRSAARR